MIAHIDGRLVHKTPTYVVIDCNGVGYHIHISLNTFGKLPNTERCKLFTHLAIREDAHILFGFISEAERELFLQLTSVSGVGPSTARMILSSLNSQEIFDAITNQQYNVLQGVKGVGTKTAQRIVIDLKDKLVKDAIAGSSVSELFIKSSNPLKEEALSALVMLGFNKAIADKALEKVLKVAPTEITLEQLIKLSLKNL